MTGAASSRPRRWRRGIRPLCPAAWLSGASLFGLMLSAPVALAVPGDGIAIPPPTRVERFNPDEKVCRPAAIEAGFARQLQPWADQPPAVLERLRQVQLEMTRATVQRCVSKGLLSAAQAADLQRRLSLTPAAKPGPAAGAAPAAAAPAKP